MPPSRLEHDLLDNARDRLLVWADDTVMRCQAVDLPEVAIMTITTACLQHALIQTLLELNMSREDFLILMQSAYQHGLEAKNRHKNVRKKPLQRDKQGA